jgi:Na+/proline symporter
MTRHQLQAHTSTTASHAAIERASRRASWALGLAGLSALVAAAALGLAVYVWQSDREHGDNGGVVQVTGEADA